MHWEVLPHTACTSDLVPSDLDLFCPLKVALAGKIYTADDKVKIYATMAGQATRNLFENGIMKLPE
jgi:hypothetical protein